MEYLDENAEILKDFEKKSSKKSPEKAYKFNPDLILLLLSSQDAVFVEIGLFAMIDHINWTIKHNGGWRGKENDITLFIVNCLVSLFCDCAKFAVKVEPQKSTPFSSYMDILVTIEYNKTKTVVRLIVESKLTSSTPYSLGLCTGQMNRKRYFQSEGVKLSGDTRMVLVEMFYLASCYVLPGQCLVFQAEEAQNLRKCYAGIHEQYSFSKAVCEMLANFGKSIKCNTPARNIYNVWYNPTLLSITFKFEYGPAICNFWRTGAFSQNSIAPLFDLINFTAVVPQFIKAHIGHDFEDAALNALDCKEQVPALDKNDFNFIQKINWKSSAADVHRMFVTYISLQCQCDPPDDPKSRFKAILDNIPKWEYVDSLSNDTFYCRIYKKNALFFFCMMAKPSNTYAPPRAMHNAICYVQLIYPDHKYFVIEFLSQKFHVLFDYSEKPYFNEFTVIGVHKKSEKQFRFDNEQISKNFSDVSTSFSPDAYFQFDYGDVHDDTNYTIKKRDVFSFCPKKNTEKNQVPKEDTLRKKWIDFSKRYLEQKDVDEVMEIDDQVAISIPSKASYWENFMQEFFYSTQGTPRGTPKSNLSTPSQSSSVVSPSIFANTIPTTPRIPRKKHDSGSSPSRKKPKLFDTQ